MTGLLIVLGSWVVGSIPIGILVGKFLRRGQR